MKVLDYFGNEYDIKNVFVEVRRCPEGIYYYCYGEYDRLTSLFPFSYERTVLRCSQDVNEILDYAEDLDRRISAERACLCKDKNARMGITVS